MNPVFGFLLFFVAVLVVSVIAKKRGRSFWITLVCNIVIAPLMVILVANAGGGSTGAAIAAFLVPVVTLFVILSSRTSEQIATEEGFHGSFRKCPYCAEPIRKEAVKCKHCGSDVAGK